MTAECWFDWTKKTALLLGQRLCWQPDAFNQREVAIEQYERCKAVQPPDAFFPQFEHAELLEQYDQQHHWQLEQRRKIRAIAR